MKLINKIRMKQIERIGNRAENDCFKFLNKLEPNEKEPFLEILFIKLRYRLGFICWEKAEKLIAKRLNETAGGSE